MSRSQVYSSTTTEKEKRERTKMDDILQKEVNLTNDMNLSNFTEDLKLKKSKVKNFIKPF